MAEPKKVISADEVNLDLDKLLREVIATCKQLQDNRIQFDQGMNRLLALVSENKKEVKYVVPQTRVEDDYAEEHACADLTISGKADLEKWDLENWDIGTICDYRKLLEELKAFLVVNAEAIFKIEINLMSYRLWAFKLIPFTDEYWPKMLELLQGCSAALKDIRSVFKQLTDNYVVGNVVTWKLNVKFKLNLEIALKNLDNGIRNYIEKKL